MEHIYSKINPELLLHIIVRKTDFSEGRFDIVDADNFIQCSVLQMNKGTTFKPHKHLWKSRTWDVIAQESWHVVSGEVLCMFYDIDDLPLAEITLREGDTSFTLQGGHNYLIMKDNTKVLEYKTGKYEGQETDKVFL